MLLFTQDESYQKYIKSRMERLRITVFDRVHSFNMSSATDQVTSSDRVSNASQGFNGKSLI